MAEDNKEQTTEEALEREKRLAAARKLMAPKGPETRIAIMTCKRSADGCTGAACFWAFFEKQRSFQEYADSPIPVKLWGFFHCNGCDCDRDTDPGYRKKLDRLVEEGVKKVHLGVCMCRYCPNIDSICESIQKMGIECVRGTH